MGRRGRKPEPIALKIARGMRSDRINWSALNIATGVPDPPGTLDEVARQEWDRIVSVMDAAGVLTKLDGAAIALYCDAYSRWVTARDRLAIEGEVIESRHGEARENPWGRLRDRAWDQMRRMLIEFGLTPSARSSVKVAPQGPKDDLGEFLGETGVPRPGRKRSQRP